MVAPTTWLPQLYQRFQPFWDRAVPSAGLALLLWACAEATGAYPSEWRLFLAVCLFLLGMGWPWVAYAAFTFFIAYPLYLISIYLAAIVLAALILTSRWAMRNLGAAVLVLITPALLPWHMEASVPLLAGLWWDEAAGALAGGLAALWLKLLAGMAGQPLDLSHLSGWAPAGTNIVTRFSGFNSLQTLLELINPFKETSQALLLHVLQVVAWALAGYLAGRLARHSWSHRWRGWAPLLSVVPASGIIWASYRLMPRLLDRLPMDATIRSSDVTLWMFASALFAALARMSYLYLRRPLFRPLRRGRARKTLTQRVKELSRDTLPAAQREGQRPETGGGRPAFKWTPSQRSRSANEADDDVIMIEVD
jgi:hypothetical protein